LKNKLTSEVEKTHVLEARLAALEPKLDRLAQVESNLEKLGEDYNN
jgi:hypothetical protein